MNNECLYMLKSPIKEEGEQWFKELEKVIPKATK